jgi:hypothetical protein
MASGLITSAARATAATPPAVAAVGAKRTAPPTVADNKALTPGQLADQIKAADALRADLMRSSAETAAANTRLERLSAQANALLATLSSARTAQINAETEATAARAHLVELERQVQEAQDALGQLACDSYIRSGGPLGDLTAILEALTSPSADRNTDTLATVHYLVDGRARLLDRVQGLRSEQVATTARAIAASTRASAAAKAAVEAKSKLDDVITGQRAALDGFLATQSAQVAMAAGVRGALLGSTDPAARAADRRLAGALAGQDFRLRMDTSSSCGKDSANYPNGQLPARALCPLYAAAGESLRREAAIAFDAMSHRYEEQTGSPLCVTDSYRSYPEQVAVKARLPGLAAAPGTSQHGLGAAVDLCGGVQNFASPAHLWMQRNAPLYGWFHPGWAEPSGVLPEPWHWEFAS